MSFAPPSGLDRDHWFSPGVLIAYMQLRATIRRAENQMYAMIDFEEVWDNGPDEENILYVAQLIETEIHAAVYDALYLDHYGSHP